MKYTLDHLKKYSGKSLDLFDYSRLQKKYAKSIADAELADDMRMKSRYDYDDTAGKLAAYRQVVAEQLQKEAEKVDAALPVVSTFDLYQSVKSASDSNKRDVGLRALTAHVEQLWKADRAGSVDYQTFMGLKNHYTRGYPKSAAVQTMDKAVENGYVKLNMAELMTISASIESQEDFDYLMKVHGYAANTPRNIKARQFVLGMVNKKAEQEDSEDDYVVDDQEETSKEAQMEGWNTEQYNQWGIDDELKSAVESGDVAQVSSLLEQGADPTVDQAEAMRMAIQSGNPEILSVLEQYGYTQEDFASAYGLGRAAQEVSSPIQQSNGWGGLDVDYDILKGMTDVLWGNSWANFWENLQSEYDDDAISEAIDELGLSLEIPYMSGSEITEIMSAPPSQVEEFAKNFYDQIQQLNGIVLAEFIPPGESEGFDAEAFGSDLAMESMGTGVSWSDDHEDHGLEIPRDAEYADFAEYDEELMQLTNYLYENYEQDDSEEME